MYTAAEIVNLLLEDKKVLAVVPSSKEAQRLHSYVKVLKCRMNAQFALLEDTDISGGRAVACELLEEYSDGSVKVKFFLRAPLKKPPRSYSIEILEA